MEDTLILMHQKVGHNPSMSEDQSVGQDIVVFILLTELLVIISAGAFTGWSSLYPLAIAFLDGYPLSIFSSM